MARVTVRYGANVIDATRQAVSYEVEASTVHEALVAFSKLYDDQELLKTQVIAYKNKTKIDYSYWFSTEVEDQDVVEIVPYVGFFAPMLAGPLFAFSWGWFAAGLALDAALVYGGYLAYDYARDYLKDLMALDNPDFGDETQTYSWTGATTTAREGIPIPIVYGTHMVGGNIIAESIDAGGLEFGWVDLTSDKPWLTGNVPGETALTTTMVLGEAPFSQIDIDNSLINDQAYSSYDISNMRSILQLDGTSSYSSASTTSLNVDFACKTGETDEAAFDVDFETLKKNITNLDGVLPDNTVVNDFHTNSEWSATYTSSRTGVEWLYLNFSYMGKRIPIAIRYGFTETPYGTPSSWVYCCATYVKAATVISYETDSGKTVTTAGQSAGFYSDTSKCFRYPSPSEGVPGNAVTTGPLQGYSRTQDSSHRYYEGVYVITSDNGAVKKLMSFPLNLGSVGGRYVRVQVKRLDLNTNHYLSLDSVTEKSGGGLYSEKVAVATIHFNKANEALSGSTPNFKFKVKGINTVRVYSDDGNGNLTYTTQWSDNPVWCLCDLLTNKRYGAGEWYSYNDIDLSAAYTAAAFCDANNFKCNLVMDTAVSLPEAVGLFLECFGGMIVFGANDTLKILVDTVSPVRQVFNRSNIIEGSLSYSFGSKQQEYNALEIQYSDENNSYNQVALFLSLGEVPVKEQSIALRGVSNETQATYVGAYKLLKNALCNSSVSFKASYSAIACEAGDVIGIQDASMSTGMYGGRFLSFTSDGNTRTVVIDQDIPFSGGTTYTVMYSYPSASGMVTATQTITSYSTTNRTITFTAATFASSIDDGDNSAYFIIYPNTSSVKLFRITQIKQNVDDRTFEIGAVAYDEDVYDPDNIVIIRDREVVPLTRTAPPVQNLRIETATDFVGFKIWYSAPISSDYYTARIQYRKETESEWVTLATMPYASGYVVAGLDRETTYIFRIVSINSVGQSNTAQAVVMVANTSSIDYPPDVVGLEVVGQGTGNTFSGKDCTITWIPAYSEAGKVPILGYVVEVWVEGICVRREHVLGITYTYTYEMNVADNGSAKAEFTFKVYAENANFLLSENPAVLQVVNSAPLTPLNLATSFEYKDCIVTWSAPFATTVDYYEVRVYSEYNGGGTLYASFNSYDTRFSYSYNYNILYTSNNPDRTLSFGVRTVDVFGGVSEWVYVNAENDAPSDVDGVTAVGVIGGMCVYWNTHDSKDVIGYDVYASLSSSIGLGDFQMTVSSTSITLSSIGGIKLEVDDVVYIKVVARDSFGPGDLTTASQVSGTVRGLALEEWSIDLPWLTGINFSVAGSTASWTSGTLMFGGEQYSIGAGTTSNHYIYWDEGASVFSTSNVIPSLTSTRWIMAYFDGSVVWPASSYKILHGGLFQASTITGDKIYGNELSSIKSYTGSLEVDINGHIRGGQAAYGTGDGFWLGYDSGAYKFSIGNPSSNYYFAYDGSAITLKGNVIIVGGGGELEGTLDWTNVTGAGKPADNATVGATWGTNLNNIPTLFQQGTPDNSLCLTNSFIGFHSTGTNWPVRIANDGGVGKFYCGDGTSYVDWNGSSLQIKGSVTVSGGTGILNFTDFPTYLNGTADNSVAITANFVGFHATEGNWPVRIYNDAGVGKFYVGDGSTKYLQWNGSDFSMSTSGTLLLLGGADLTLRGSNSDPGKIVWAPAAGSNTVDFGLDETGSLLSLLPNGATSLIIGSWESGVPWSAGPQKFQNIIVRSYQNDLRAYSPGGTDYARLNQVSTGSSTQTMIQSLCGGYSTSIKLYTTPSNSDFTRQYMLFKGAVASDGGGFNGCRIKAGTYVGTGGPDAELQIQVPFAPKYFKAYRDSSSATPVEGHSALWVERSYDMPAGYAVYYNGSSTTWQADEVWFTTEAEPAWSTVTVGGRFSNVEGYRYYCVIYG
jgi:sulfur carrier protein ThiS